MANLVAKRLSRVTRRRRRPPKLTAEPVATELRFEPPPEQDGGAGVREPRRPRPSAPGGPRELAFRPEQRLDLTERGA